ncbi:MAG: molybdenum cofactor guanylyltransferase [Actinomycetota bacterium]|nr:molybdenum cofactor guanylyltransferase [Actinomycetota bacterium]
MANPDVTGVLLVGGASRRFGSAKALARLEGETLAERAYRTLGQAFGSVIAVGKADDRLALPFPVVDDGSEVRAPIVGVAAALRLAATELCVFLPTDMPLVTAGLLVGLADAAQGIDAAVPQTGPLPGAYRRSVLPVLERRIELEELSLAGALADLEARVVPMAEESLRNANTAAELAAIAASRSGP